MESSCLSYHVRDLKDDESADPNDWKNLKWESTSKGRKHLRKLENLQKIPQEYILPQIQIEGEAIAWHILDHLQEKLVEGRQINRISFNEITPSAIKNAIENPRDIDQFLVDAYFTRRS